MCSCGLFKKSTISFLSAALLAVTIGCGGSSGGGDTPDGDKNPAPSGLTVTAKTTYSDELTAGFTLSWDSVEGVTGYKVMLSYTEDSVNGNEYVLSDDTTYTFEGKYPDTYYWVAVSAYIGDEESARTAWLKVKTDAVTTGTIRVFNFSTAKTYNGVYLALAGSSDWGENRLKDGPLLPDDYIYLTNIEPGTYKFLITTENTATTATGSYYQFASVVVVAKGKKFITAKDIEGTLNSPRLNTNKNEIIE